MDLETNILPLLHNIIKIMQTIEGSMVYPDALNFAKLWLVNRLMRLDFSDFIVNALVNFIAKVRYENTLSESQIVKKWCKTGRNSTLNHIFGLHR